VEEACACQGELSQQSRQWGGRRPTQRGTMSRWRLLPTPHTYTQAQGASPQEPEHRGHATRQYTVKVSLLPSETLQPMHPAPVARVGTHRVQEDTGR